jgi:NADH-quinone oxidoreductase subunit C
MSERKDIISNIINKAEVSGLKEVINSTPMCFEVSSSSLLSVCRHLHENTETYFDMLSCITGVDNGVEANTMDVIYHLYSIPFNQSLALKVVLSRTSPELPSVSSVWKSANWLEREVYDMFGIVFKEHPDLRRILLPADWNGFPLRKDYKHEEYYRGVKIEY